jgi:hypothetical protein
MLNVHGYPRCPGSTDARRELMRTPAANVCPSDDGRESCLMTGSVFTDSGLTRLGGIAVGRVADYTVPGLVVLVSSGDQVQVEAHGTLGTDDDRLVR